MRTHIVLIGLPGSGKSTVGRIAAEILNVECWDVDDAIAEQEGVPVGELIVARGEREFRELEKVETERALCGPATVVVPGGGWAAWGNNLATAQSKATFVYLKTSVNTAIERVGQKGDRPLLNGPDPKERMRVLYEKRAQYYEQCDVTIDTDHKSPAQVADEVVELAQGAMAG